MDKKLVAIGTGIVVVVIGGAYMLGKKQFGISNEEFEEMEEMINDHEEEA